MGVTFAAPDAFGNADFLTVELDPQQAMTGIDTSVTLPDGRSITVRLPAGVPHGMVLRLTAPDQAAGGRDIYLQVILTSAVPAPLVTPPETSPPATPVPSPPAAPVEAAPPRTRWWQRSSARSSGPGATAAVEPTQPTAQPTMPVEPTSPTSPVESVPSATRIESAPLSEHIDTAAPTTPAETAQPTPADSTQPTASGEGAQPNDHVELSRPSVPAGSLGAPETAGPATEVGELTPIAGAGATSTIANDEATTADADGTASAADAGTRSTPAEIGDLRTVDATGESTSVNTTGPATAADGVHHTASIGAADNVVADSVVADSVADVSTVDSTATADAATAAYAHSDATTAKAAAEPNALSDGPVADAPVGTDVQGAVDSTSVTHTEDATRLAVPADTSGATGATGLAAPADVSGATAVAPPTVSAERYVPDMVPPMSAPPYPYGPQFPPPYLAPAPRSRRMAGWQIAVSAVAVLIFAAFGGAATAVVRYASDAGEQTAPPTVAGTPTPGPTLTTKPRMTAGAYQTMLTKVDTAISAGVTALAQSGNPTAVDKAAAAIAAAAEKGRTDLLAVVPPKNAEKAHETLTDALDELADSGTQLSMSAQSGGVCMASSAMPRFSSYPVIQTLRSAFEALAAADKAHPYTMGAWLPAPTQDQNRQPGNGTYLKNGSRSGSGQMKLDSKDNASDAVLGLVGVGTDSMVFTVYVRAGSSFTVTGVRNGNYDVYVTMGTDWDPDHGGFSRNCNFTKFDQSIEFTNSSTTYTVWSITLQYVAGGGGTLTVDPDKFPR